MPTSDLPRLPVPVKHFIRYLADHPDDPVSTLVEPFKAFESKLRKIYAQQPDHESLEDGAVNLVPIFAGDEAELKIRARSLCDETEEERSKYIMPLEERERKVIGGPALVSSVEEFRQNFNYFSNSSLSDLEWDNVVAAGSSVATSLVPVPEKWASRKMQYYRENFAPTGDVDLFLYGLSEQQALEKIKQIERKIKENAREEVITVRTKNAITIASRYPTRHVQIVLRLYDSISQILTGFDVDCACAAYNGCQVYTTPRAIAAYMTQCNTVDLDRRSRSYENRLYKYRQRGFEVHWPLLERSRVHQSIYEVPVSHTQGLARLLSLENLSKRADRNTCEDKGDGGTDIPPLCRSSSRRRKNSNVEDEGREDEIDEEKQQGELSSYHTTSIPYGPRYSARDIYNILHNRDAVCNAEWNQPEGQEVYLHRHPCFFGTAEQVIRDCCGCCPVPQTDKEMIATEKDAMTYVSGPMKFRTDDPGRQEIGSFNPVNDDEWTTMAYTGAKRDAYLLRVMVDADTLVECLLTDLENFPLITIFIGVLVLVQHTQVVAAIPLVFSSLLLVFHTIIHLYKSSKKLMKFGPLFKFKCIPLKYLRSLRPRAVFERFRIAYAIIYALCALISLVTTGVISFLTTSLLTLLVSMADSISR
ncbi:hypothetical protein F5884DRAFT_814057 [Xylogone sp. PMI_703]|nr:hypothetical protein F5884DRAFT_814057 [Xylogone sp. PMI_703]